MSHTGSVLAEIISTLVLKYLTVFAQGACLTNTNICVQNTHAGRVILAHIVVAARRQVIKLTHFSRHPRHTMALEAIKSIRADAAVHAWRTITRSMVDLTIFAVKVWSTGAWSIQSRVDSAYLGASVQALEFIALCRDQLTSVTSQAFRTHTLVKTLVYFAADASGIVEARHLKAWIHLGLAEWSLMRCQANTFVRGVIAVLGTRRAAFTADLSHFAVLSLIEISALAGERVDAVYACAIVLAWQELTIVNVFLALFALESNRTLTDGLFTDKLTACMLIHTLATDGAVDWSFDLTFGASVDTGALTSVVGRLKRTSCVKTDSIAMQLVAWVLSELAWCVL